MSADPDPGKFDWKPDDVLLSQCAYCRHFAGGAFAAVCGAFPAGVPSEVLENRFDHAVRHPDEAEPLRFEPRPDVPAGTLSRLRAELRRP
jgi:hypothetical protein